MEALLCKYERCYCLTAWKHGPKTPQGQINACVWTLHRGALPVSMFNGMWYCSRSRSPRRPRESQSSCCASKLEPLVPCSPPTRGCTRSPARCPASACNDRDYNPGERQLMGLQHPTKGSSLPEGLSASAFECMHMPPSAPTPLPPHHKIMGRLFLADSVHFCKSYVVLLRRKSYVVLLRQSQCVVGRRGSILPQSELVGTCFLWHSSGNFH